MDLDRFWELLEAAAVANDVDCEAQAERLTAMLEQLASEETTWRSWIATWSATAARCRLPRR